jgi:hypothetical protein
MVYAPPANDLAGPGIYQSIVMNSSSFWLARFTVSPCLNLGMGTLAQLCIDVAI